MDWHVFVDWLQAQLTTNQFFAGGIVMGLIGWAAVTAREWPLAIGRFLGRQFITEVEIRSTDGPAFMHAALWLAKHEQRKNARRLGMIDYWDNEAEDTNPNCPGGSGEDDYQVTFGFGNHVIWQGLLPVFINRSVSGGENTNVPVQSLTFRTLGRNHDAILRILQDAKAYARTSTKVSVYLWTSGHYTTLDRKEPRPVESVIMPHEDRDDIIADLQGFITGKGWYQRRGLPWRRGYLLEGPPGTGKSSTIFALAGVVRKDIHIINPATISNDNELMMAFAQAGKGVVVIEDIDAIEITEKRETGKDKEKERKGITLSGLLNAIDGVTARDGRILFITSNHPDKLDPALIRPGRVDKRVHLGLLTRELGAEMFDRFFPGEDPSVFLNSHVWPKSPAEVQGALLKWDTGSVVSLDDYKVACDKTGAGETLARAVSDPSLEARGPGVVSPPPASGSPLP